jgi:hypothetical protein
MILMLRDDNVIVLFESPNDPPGRLEAMDIENEEYRFCDATGQRYKGVITRPVGVFSAGAFVLRPEGLPELKNAIDLIDQAVGLEANKWYEDLASLRRHLTRP